ncbi:hypothetical protein SAMN04489864_106270, partial [Pedobacter insulae]
NLKPEPFRIRLALAPSMGIYIIANGDRNVERFSVLATQLIHIFGQIDIVKGKN